MDSAMDYRGSGADKTGRRLMRSAVTGPIAIGAWLNLETAVEKMN